MESAKGLLGVSLAVLLFCALFELYAGVPGQLQTLFEGLLSSIRELVYFISLTSTSGPTSICSLNGVFGVTVDRCITWPMIRWVSLIVLAFVVVPCYFTYLRDGIHGRGGVGFMELELNFLSMVIAVTLVLFNFHDVQDLDVGLYAENHLALIAWLVLAFNFSLFSMVLLTNAVIVCRRVRYRLGC